MQQDALNKLGLTMKKVTSCAQELYEGVTLGDEGKVALITYIRTDSVRVAPDAQKMAKDFILKNFGEKYVPKTPNVYKVKNSAQDAHEAIRPISLDRTPEMVKPYLSSENYKLYKLIYNKFLASQMAEAVFDSVVVEIENNDYIFKCSGKTPVFDGHLRLTNSSKKEKVKEELDDDSEGENSKLPPMNEGDELTFKEMITTQKFTKPNPRYTEASLVKEMEEKGIGRPSTYAPTISTLVDRFYVEKEGRMLVPTELGEVVNNIMVENFKDIVDVQFTANMEGKLDSIAEGNLNHVDMLKEFYTPFITNLENVADTIQRVELKDKETDIVCELCGRNMVIKRGKFGEFLACPGYPECKNAKPIVNSIKEPCPHCGGKVLIKKTKTKRNFYICEYNTNDENKKCDYISWNKPGVEPKKATRKVKKKTATKKATTKSTKTTKTKTTKKTSK
jgi:DNA topoisomerase-1